MARKQPGRSREMAAPEADAKSIRLELPGAVHQEFRVEAAKEGKSMAAVARQLVEDWLKKRKGVGK